MDLRRAGQGRAQAGLTPSAKLPRLLLYYHFFHPDQVVSARIFSDFAAEQARRGWDVTALTCNRSHGDGSARFPPDEVWNDLDMTHLQVLGVIAAARPGFTIDDLGRVLARTVSEASEV